MLQKRTKRSQLNPLKNNLNDAEDLVYLYFDLDIYVGYRRPEIIKYYFTDDDYELSDYVKTRLLLARFLALKKYQKIWG